MFARLIHKILVHFAHVGMLRTKGDVIAEQEYLDKLFPDEAIAAQTRPVVQPSLVPTPQPPVPEFDPTPIAEVIGDFIKAGERTPEPDNPNLPNSGATIFIRSMTSGVFGSGPMTKTTHHG